ncbi:hypothetical protein IIC38_14375 [candidate division KSB1 bacterium]|nr:hypothetical protein [candidate division KSB1 bacterium]
MAKAYTSCARRLSRRRRRYGWLYSHRSSAGYGSCASPWVTIAVTLIRESYGTRLVIDLRLDYPYKYLFGISKFAVALMNSFLITTH